MNGQITVPRRLATRPIAANGYHVPWFVHVDEADVPDFRVLGKGKFEEAVTRYRCWICGQRLGKYKAFNVGPANTIKRISGEPPSHNDCATYAALSCPFLSHPNAKRREGNLPEEVELYEDRSARNPGLTCVWITTDYQVFPAPRTIEGYLIQIAEPERMVWYRQGRPATRDEVRESLAEAKAKLIEAAPSEAVTIQDDYVKLLALLPP